MPGFQELFDSQPETYREAATSLDAAATAFTRLRDTFSNAVNTAGAKWTGDAKDYFSQTTTSLNEGLGSVAGQLRVASDTANQAASALGAARDALRAAVEAAKAEQFDVNDGIVSVSAIQQEEAEAEADAALEAAPAVYAGLIAALEAAAAAQTAEIRTLLIAGLGLDRDFAATFMSIRMELDGLIPFMEALSWPAHFKYDGKKGSNAQGAIGEDLNLALATLNDEQVLDTQVPIGYGGKVSNLDRLVRDRDGNVIAYEVKTNNAELSDNQGVVLPRIKLGGATLQDEVDSSMPSGTVLRPGDMQVKVQRWNTNGVSPDVQSGLEKFMSDVNAGGTGKPMDPALEKFLRDPGNRIETVL